ncbi:MAG: LptF/LptG family permease [candidate division WOR-3 bacterium]|nr:MAG: LptF/LptG family permease [candidate division WOR-3 bacterium]
MIKTVDRYFIKEFIPPFFFSIFALTFILLMDQLFRLIDLFVRKGLPFAIVGQVLVYSLPHIISYTAPMAILVGIVMSFGRFAHDNEILALKTSGLTFLSLMKIPLVITSLFVIFLVFFNSYILPESNHRARNLMLDVSRKRPAIRLPQGVFTNEFPGYTVYIGRKDERRSKLFDITVYDQRSGVMITAPHGDLEDIDEDIIQFTLYDGELHQLIDDVKYQRTSFARQIINMEVNTELIRKERTYRNETELVVTGLHTKITETKQEIAALISAIDTIGRDAVAQFMTGNEHRLGPAKFQIQKKLNEMKAKQRRLSRYLIELNKKYSLAVACILFVLIGAPLGYLSKKGGIAGILIGIMLFSLYYILVLAGEEFADRRGFSSFWAMWLPNIILFAAGIYFYLVAEYERPPWRFFFK